MFARLIAVAQEMRTKPPTLAAAIVGAVVAGLGLAVVQRYHAALARSLSQDSVTAEEIRWEVADAERRRDKIAAELKSLHDQAAVLRDKVYPAPEDVDPLGNGEGQPE